MKRTFLLIGLNILIAAAPINKASGGERDWVYWVVGGYVVDQATGGHVLRGLYNALDISRSYEAFPHRDPYEEGYRQGLRRGHAEGRERWHRENYNLGYRHGYEEGYYLGYGTR